jgi:hypothetical protein
MQVIFFIEKPCLNNLGEAKNKPPSTYKGARPRSVGLS